MAKQRKKSSKKATPPALLPDSATAPDSVATATVEPCSWTTEDETCFLDALFEIKAEAGDGMSFKMTSFNAVALLVDKGRVKGGVKTGKACQNKWTTVRLWCSLSLYII